MSVQLGGAQEKAFRNWYSERATRLNLDANPDAPEHFYDYRAAFQAGAEPDETGHWPSEFKQEGNPRTYLNGMDTRTGLPVDHMQPSIEGLQPLADDFNPADLNGYFSGLGEELMMALPRAALKAAGTVNLLATPLAAGFDQDAQDRWFSAMVDPPFRSLDEIDERSAINGSAARVVGQLASVALEAPLGPVGVGVVEAGGRTGQELYSGETADKATALGALTGGTMSIGFALPMSLAVKPGFGPALLQRLGYGVGTNVALGAAQRGGEAALGEDTRVLDGTALAVDAAIGALFGGIAHIANRRGDADAAMTLVEQASAQRAVPPGEPSQPALDHLAAKVKAAHDGIDIPDPPVNRAAAKIVDDAATASERALRDADPGLARIEEPGSGEPLPLPKVEEPKGPPKSKVETDSWNPVNQDGEEVSIDLPALRKSAEQLDALGAKRPEDGRTYSEILKEATKTKANTESLLDAVSQCVLNYGH